MSICYCIYGKSDWVILTIYGGAVLRICDCAELTHIVLKTNIWLKWLQDLMSALFFFIFKTAVHYTILLPLLYHLIIEPY
jgi:hypothetical protein